MARPIANPCGTYAAYERHRRAGETPCEACFDAMRARSRAQYAERVGRPVRRWRPVRCGTASGWANHYREGTQVCDPCRKAHRDYMRAWRRKKKDRPRMAQTIVDVLITHDRWLNTDALVSLVLDLHPEWSGDAVRRKALALADIGVIAVRQQTHAIAGFRTYVMNEYRADDEAWELVA